MFRGRRARGGARDRTLDRQSLHAANARAAAAAFDRHPATMAMTRRPRSAAPERRAAAGFLAVHGVEKSFAGRKVVRGASLYVRQGEAVGLLGPNGAGKTTVFYMITGLIKADRGSIELDGHDIT